jgi:hypothetical protein
VTIINRQGTKQHGDTLMNEFHMFSAKCEGKANTSDGLFDILWIISCRLDKISEWDWTKSASVGQISVELHVALGASFYFAPSKQIHHGETTAMSNIAPSFYTIMLHNTCLRYHRLFS